MHIDYEIIYSDRKTIGIVVERDRSVIIRAPHGVSKELIERAVESKKLWLYEKLRHPRKYDNKPKSKNLIPGTSLLYLGQEYTLQFTPKRGNGLTFDGGFKISRSLLPKASEIIRAWYIEEAKKRITPKALYFARQLGVDFNKVLISDLKYRWGSCTPKNNLNFNWRLIKAPISVIEYVVDHELAHLLESNHTPRFWSILRIQIPQYSKAREWLKKYGGLLEEKI